MLKETLECVLNSIHQMVSFHFRVITIQIPLFGALVLFLLRCVMLVEEKDEAANKERCYLALFPKIRPMAVPWHNQR